MKILLFSFALLGVLTFSGCGQINNSETTSNPSSEAEATLPVPKTETTVKDLKTYDSSDEVLTDIDTAMKDLDNL